jgi:segregation and condensation protein A
MMTRGLPAHESLAGYQLKLPTFEGALDVLLSLIEREKLEISDLSLVMVTDGFLTYIEDMADPPPALLAEFIGIAARLLVLKSRSLLPRIEASEPETEVDDLASQLREYQKARHAAEMLRDRHHRGVRTFSRKRLELATPARVVLTPSPVTHLRRALLRALARVSPDPDVAALTPLVPISAVIGRFRAFLASRRRVSFRELVGDDRRSDTIAGFIALLALWRNGEIEVSQDALFGDIHVRSMPELLMVDLAADD